jgi:hypothetical protein
VTSAPEDLGPRGRAFWRATLDRWELTGPETELLTEVCRTLDEIDGLREVLPAGLMSTGSTGQPVVHPALAQIRASRALVGRLLAQLQLPDETGASLPSPAQIRASKAVQARWSRVPARSPRGGGRGTAA